MYEDGGKKENKEKKNAEDVNYGRKQGIEGLLGMPRMQMAAAAAALTEN